MKKIFAILTTLCLLCAACAAVADTEIPDFDKMPGAVIEDDETTVDEAVFQGEWVLDVAFAGTEYVDNETLSSTYGYDFAPIVIADGKVTKEIQNDNGEFYTVEMPYTFEAGQLQGTDENGRSFAIDPLEDGSIALAVFYPGEGDEVTCLTLFLVHPAE